MSSAIEKARELNDKKIPVSIAFLSDSANDSAKARYATTTYLQLIRRIASMGLKASIQVPLSQIGYEFSDEIAAKNMQEILSTANKYGVFVWLEVRSRAGKIPSFLYDAKGVGYAVSIKDAREYIRRNRQQIKALKVLCAEQRSELKDGHSEVSARLQEAAENMKNTVLQSVPESAVGRLLNGGKLKKAVIFEFQLGYSGKKVSSMMKKGVRTSMYVPFGKDWSQYAVNKAPERYARFIATTILGQERGA